MSQASPDYEIPQLEAQLFFGISTNIAGNIHFLSDSELLHAAGKVLVIDNLQKNCQKFIKIPSSRKNISIICISPDRKYVGVGESGEGPRLSVFEVSTLGRLKHLGVPAGVAAGARDWAAISFLGSDQLVAVTSQPDWSLLVYDWRRAKLLYQAPASPDSRPVRQVVPNPEDGTVMGLVGEGLFRLLSRGDSSWRGYGFSRAERLPLQTAAWIGTGQLLAGSFDGRLLLVDNGELRAVYQAQHLSEISLLQSATKTSDAVTLASQAVPDENKNGLHEVRSLISFGKGFLYSCNPGEVTVFKKVGALRWLKKNLIRISSGLPDKEYRGLHMINSVSVNPSNSELVATVQKTEIYRSHLFSDEEDPTVKNVLEFRMIGSGYHNGQIAALASCLWKPIILSAGAQDKTIRLWNYETLEVLMIKRFSDEIYSAALHPSGFSCLLGFTDKLRYMLILVNDMKMIRHVDIRGCRNATFATGGHIFAATRDELIEVYSAIYFTKIHVLQGHLGPVSRLEFSIGDWSLWSCGAEGSLYEWDMRSGRRLTDVFTSQNGQLGLAVNEAVYTVGTDGNLKEIIDGEISREVDMQQSSLTAVTLGNSGQMLFLGGEKSCVVSVVYPLVHPPKLCEFVMHSKPIADIAITQDDTALLTTCEDGFLCIWRIVSAQEKKMDMNRDFGHVSQVLLDLDELVEMQSQLKELGDRLLETEGEHEYAIRQIIASNETALKETNTNYTTIIEDLKFRIKQMEREHFVEINKIQTKLKEERGSHSNAIDQLEKHYNEKLLAELTRIEELNKLLDKSKEDYESLEVEMKEKLQAAEARFAEISESSLKKKDSEISELKKTLKAMEEEKEKSQLLLEEEFNKKKEDVGKSFVTKVLEKEMLIGKLKNENGVLVKTHILIRKEINGLEEIVEKLEEEVRMKENTLKLLLEEADLVKAQLEERESVIAKREKALVKLTKLNDINKRDVLFRDTTAQALLEKIVPKDEALRNHEALLEEKMKEIDKLTQLRNKSTTEIDQLKKRLSLKEKEIKKEKIRLFQINSVLRKVYFKEHYAATKEENGPSQNEKLTKFLTINEFNTREESRSYNTIMMKQNRMEKIIDALSKSVQAKKRKTSVENQSHKIAYEILTQFNKMVLELNESRRKVRYLQKLLDLGHKYNK